MKTNVPKHIRDAMRKAAKYNAKAREYEEIIESWFETTGIKEDDGVRDVYIDYVQQSNNPEAAIKKLESIVYMMNRRN
ncbi:hypothetical protein [Paenibacillus medicaginis]|uniref:Phage protein n=1 Tax=Paenibacillus medicaginis TaxID=1470560 RepID=A0ABV5BV56_9BACL